MKNFQTLVQSPKLTGIQENYKGNSSANFNVGNARAFSDSPSPHRGSVKPPGQINQLTNREKEVLQLVAEGKANKEAASELCISVKTVEKHRESLMDKLGIRGTALLTHFAIAAGITPCNPWLGGNHARSREFHLAAR